MTPPRELGEEEGRCYHHWEASSVEGEFSMPGALLGRPCGVLIQPGDHRALAKPGLFHYPGPACSRMGYRSQDLSSRKAPCLV